MASSKSTTPSPPGHQALSVGYIWAVSSSGHGELIRPFLLLFGEADLDVEDSPTLPRRGACPSPRHQRADPGRGPLIGGSGHGAPGQLCPRSPIPVWARSFARPACGVAGTQRRRVCRAGYALPAGVHSTGASSPQMVPRVSYERRVHSCGAEEHWVEGGSGCFRRATASCSAGPGGWSAGAWRPRRRDHPTLTAPATVLNLGAWDRAPSVSRGSRTMRGGQWNLDEIPLQSVGADLHPAGRERALTAGFWLGRTRRGRVRRVGDATSQPCASAPARSRP